MLWFFVISWPLLTMFLTACRTSRLAYTIFQIANGILLLVYIFFSLVLFALGSGFANWGFGYILACLAIWLMLTAGFAPSVWTYRRVTRRRREFLREEEVRRCYGATQIELEDFSPSNRRALPILPPPTDRSSSADGSGFGTATG